MTNDFWLERWNDNKIGFHQSSVNQRLTEFAGKLDLKPGSRAFVPLCGKSLDMLWLREQGTTVLGVELSPTAVEAFFAENGIEARVSQDGPFMRHSGEGIEILCGDFFALRDSDLADVTAVYDRAALIALPPELRLRYAAHLTALLPHGARILLETIEYPQEQMDGPPFSVPEENVRELFGEGFSIERLAEADILDEEERFRERGITELGEKVYVMVKG